MMDELLLGIFFIFILYCKGFTSTYNLFDIYRLYMVYDIVYIMRKIYTKLFLITLKSSPTLC